MSRRPPPGGPSLRVVAGRLRGRRLEAPTGTATRPTSDRVRQALFNALDSLDGIEGARVLDGFAGSGALGIEALSRGAAHATFVETDAAARAVIERNVATLGLGAQVRVVPRPLAQVLGELDRFELVLLDPPYAYGAWDDLLHGVLPVLTDDAVVVIESDRVVALPSGLRDLRSKAYGGTVVQFATPSGVPL